MKEIKPTYVTFEQAKWLKDKGYKSKSRYYDGSGKLVSVPNIPENDYRHTNNYMQRFRWEAPEQWEVVEWLRINHNLWVEAPYSYNDGNVYCWSIVKINEEESDKDCWLSGFDTEIVGFDTPQDAYSEAFDYIRLNNLI